MPGNWISTIMIPESWLITGKTSSAEEKIFATRNSLLSLIQKARASWYCGESSIMDTSVLITFYLNENDDFGSI
jgi:hypothetical protein